MKKVSFIDFETTGLNPKKGFITEVAIIQMSYTIEGKLRKVLKQYTSFNDPGEPIPAKIIELTGITNDLVKGHSIDWSKVNYILNESDIIVAHNADFDKKWAIQHGKCRDDKWLCSVSMIDWKMKHGFAKAKLEYLKEKYEINAPSHRAIDDVRTLVKILKQPSKYDSDKTYFQELLENSKSIMFEVVLSNTKYQDKDIIKSLGFYWQPKTKSWKASILGTKLEKVLREINKIPHIKVKHKEKK